MLIQALPRGLRLAFRLEDDLRTRLSPVNTGEVSASQAGGRLSKAAPMNGAKARQTSELPR